MNSYICKLVQLLGLSGLTFLVLTHVQAETLNLSLGGKNTSASLFPSTSTIAKSVNRNSSKSGIRITIKSKRDSASIIRDVMSGKLNFGVARMNHILQAYNGLGEWEGTPQTDLRSVFNVHGEHLALFSSVNSTIQTIQDLKGHRVFIGTPHSDIHHTVSDILTAAEIDPANDITVTICPIDEVADLFIEDEIDAFFITMGIVNRTFIELLSIPETIRLVPINGSSIDQMIAKNPFYEKSTIGRQEYPYLANHLDVNVLGVRAGLITTERTWKKTTYTVVREVFDYRDIFKSSYPNATILSRDEITKNMATPLHPGAAEYFQKRGIPYDFIEP